MSKIKMPADGGGGNKGMPDGVSASPHEDRGSNVHGRTEGGESAGAAYPNPYTGMKPTNSGLFGHGGQTMIDYHGGNEASANAVTGSGEPANHDHAPQRSAEPEHAATYLHSSGEGFEVAVTSGVAEAERSGKIGTDSAYEQEQEAPGSG